MIPMLQELYGLFGVPKCAREGCPYPGIVRFEFSDENGSVWVDLCPACLAEVKQCLGELSSVMEERRQALGHDERPAPTLPYSENDDDGR